jgi:hypothetical protein
MLEVLPDRYRDLIVELAALYTVEPDPARQQPRGTRGRPPKKTQSVKEAIKDDVRTGHFTMREGCLFDRSRKVVQKALMHRYDCGKSTLLDALSIVRSELKTPTNYDKK